MKLEVSVIHSTVCIRSTKRDEHPSSYKGDSRHDYIIHLS